MTETKYKLNKSVFFAVAVILGTLAIVAGVQVSRLIQTDAKTLSGANIRWADENWKVVNFFAPWCAPCLREIPVFNALNELSTNKVKVIGISYDDASLGELQALVKKLNVQFDVIDTSAAVSLPMPYPDYLPATYIITPQGKVAETLYGEQTEASLHQKLSQIL